MLGIGESAVGDDALDVTGGDEVTDRWAIRKDSRQVGRSRVTKDCVRTE
jgi:hypothetical protein